MNAQSFTRVAKEMRDTLTSEVHVSAYSPDHFANGSAPQSSFKEFKGLWDTGATGSVITQKIVDELRLSPVDFATVHHAQGSSVTEVYLVDVGLPNHVAVPMLRVTKGILADFDMLVGMDVINTGDFAVSNFCGRTMFTFRVPSLEDADFTGKANAPKGPTAPPVCPAEPRISRNAPCPCGSGKKYKKCCGAAK